MTPKIEEKKQDVSETNETSELIHEIVELEADVLVGLDALAVCDTEFKRY
jgi:hypothetical protein